MSGADLLKSREDRGEDELTGGEQREFELLSPEAD